MHRHIGRVELIDRLLPELRREHEADPSVDAAALDTFTREVLRRVDDRYLYRHRLVTLGRQLLDSYRWITSAAAPDEIRVRVFTPTEAEQGYALEGVVVETVMPDQPFIVDTLKLMFEQHGVRVINALHVVLPAAFDAEGHLRWSEGDDAPDARQVSYTRSFVDPTHLPGFDAVREEIGRRLGFARRMVRDFYRMLRRVKDIANEFDYLSNVDPSHASDCEEVRDFLHWLGEDNFVFMGISACRLDGEGGVEVVPDEGMGAMADTAAPSGPATPEALAFFADNPGVSWPILRVRKSPDESPVHRAGKVDEVLVRLFDDRGNPAGGAIIHGLFTFKGLSEPGSQIPILRRKLQNLLRAEGSLKGGYEYKGFTNAFNTLPVEFLFEATLEGIRDLLLMTLTADATREIHCQVVLNPDNRSAFAFIMLPKEHYSDDLRARMQDALRADLRASYADHRVYLGKFGTVALHFYLTGAGDFGTDALDAVEARLVRIGTPWTYRLRQRLELEHGEAATAEIYSLYAEAFPESYTDVTHVDDAVVDIHHLGLVADRGEVRFDVFADREDPQAALLRIYSREPMQLTSILPVVDNFGVIVLEQAAVDVKPARSPALSISTLRVRRGERDVLAQRGELIGALAAVFRRRMRSDRLNRLLLGARLSWKEVDLFRALFNYSRQLGHQLDPETVHKVLMGHSALVADLARLFRMRFDPGLDLDEADRQARVDALTEEARRGLDAVASFEEDRILRLFLDLIHAIVRTSFFRVRDDDEHLIAFKIDSARVPVMPEPRPMVEIFVHHAHVEGVHLRGGRVARGGIRWSDRLDDYRSEVLGLMATQMLKNTLIVPVGAKGGFVLKEPVEDPREARAAADRLYRVFIRGLLELTDNIVDGAVVKPPGVRCYDGDDPYLVVAADKGTAHLSDAANELSASFDFWLGDAFASGGSVGYDHKAKAITARGAWVCVRRHFRELGLDPERDPVTAVGIGDMSGDVFGNGMLLSRTMKLVAAFNHRHIFLDPDPDPEAAWAERKRLFDLPRSQWSDYAPALISEGGGVFDRGAKAIALPEPARRLLRTDRQDVSGEELIRLILRAEVDLLWNGGIGTYVKSAAESHQDVEDKANDRVRVNADELRCRVIGEGGNLGLTARARVEFAERGGRINLDAIDNSGGVDLSDHEVNLKILLRRATRTGRLTREQRNELLMRLGDAVCEQVLDDSEQQSLGISLDVIRSRRDVWAFMRATEFLRERLGFSRRRERLPSRVEEFDARAERDLGLLRPELGKLLSYAKMLVYPELVERPVGDEAALRPYLLRYFPAAAVEACPEAVDHHMLRREIAATVQLNHIVAQAGVTFYPDMIAATDRSASEITAAWLLAEELLGARALRAAIEERAATLRAQDGYLARVAVEEAVVTTARWILGLQLGPVSLATREALAPVARTLEALSGRWRRVLPPDAVRELDTEEQQWTAAGFDEALAGRIAALTLAPHPLLVARLAEGREDDLDALAALYFAVGYAVHVIPLMRSTSHQTYRVPWDEIAVYSIERGLYASVLRLARLVAGAGERPPSLAHVDARLAAMPALDGLRRDVEAILRKQIPVSAMFVLGERLARRIDEMEAAAEAPRPARGRGGKKGKG